MLPQGITESDQAVASVCSLEECHASPLVNVSITQGLLSCLLLCSLHSFALPPFLSFGPWSRNRFLFVLWAEGC